jgi:hypothetical protein
VNKYGFVAGPDDGVPPEGPVLLAVDEQLSEGPRPAPRAEPLHVLMLPNFERADAIGSH